VSPNVVVNFEMLVCMVFHTEPVDGFQIPPSWASFSKIVGNSPFEMASFAATSPEGPAPKIAILLQLFKSITEMEF